MPRPQKYSDAEIVSAIQSLIANGEEVNPTRIRQRLGGGNSTRIKAIIDQYVEEHGSSNESLAGMPERLRKELQRTDDQILRLTRRLADEIWGAARDEVTSSLRDQAVSLQKRVEAMEVDLGVSAETVARLETERSEVFEKRDKALEEINRLSQQCDHLTAALRNAESDLRASERTVSVLERTQRQDRDEIRKLHKRVEELVAELAALKSKR